MRRIDEAVAARRGFTLVELLVVISIIVMVSAVTISAARSWMGERAVQEAAQLVDAAVQGARRGAMGTAGGAGIRLVPDPALPGAYSSIIPLVAAPDYSEGLITPYHRDGLPPGTAPGPCLTIVQAAKDRHGLPAPPTGWYWNVRVGERIRFGDVGPWFTIVGPMEVDNPEGFVNSTATPIEGPGEFLFLTNGRDDDKDGFTDDGADGVDNDGDGATDEADEWEEERWDPFPADPSAYRIARKLVPAPPVATIALPAGAVIDATTATTTRERSRLPVGRGGFIDVAFDESGRPVTPEHMLFFWVAAREDVHAPFANPPGWFLLPMPPGTPGYPAELPTLGSDALIVAVDRSGTVATSAPGQFDAPGVPIHYPPMPGYPKGSDDIIRADGPFRIFSLGR